MDRRRRVVITGVGAVAPKAIGTTVFWHNLLVGKSGIDRITSFDVSGLKSQIGGEVDLNALKPLVRKGFKIHRFGKNTLFGLVAAISAIEDSKISLDTEIATIFGVCASPFDVQARHIPTDSGNPVLIPSILPNSLAAVVGDYFGNTGRSLTTSTACASGADAILLAYEQIAGGREHIVITGGADSAIALHPFIDFDSIGMISRRNDAPQKASRPFDKNRDGGLASEGGGILVLEERRHALARGAKIYAEIKGGGTSVDKKGGEHGCGLVESMAMALGNAALLPSRVQYVNAHGPSDATMDRVETQAIKKVFGSHAKSLMVSSIKGVTGNPLAAAGPLQTVATALCLHEKVVHPTANYEFPDPDCDLDYVPTARRVAVENVVINSHGVGGANVSLVLCRHKR